MATGNLRFDGRGPYYLRAVEHATASVLDDTIQLTLYASVDNAAEKLVKIETQMTLDAADDLAKVLRKAAGRTSDNPKS